MRQGGLLLVIVLTGTSLTDEVFGVLELVACQELDGICCICLEGSLLLVLLVFGIGVALAVVVIVNLPGSLGVNKLQSPLDKDCCTLAKDSPRTP